MAMPYRTMLAVAVALLPALPVAAQVRYDGQAYAADSQRLLYRESHWNYSDHGVASHLVLYRCPGGAAFARKQLRESPSAIAPDFDFIDARTGYREGVRTRAGAREVYQQKDAQSPMRVKPLQARPDAVIDAGFDAFVRSRWDAISAKHPVKAAFLLPSRFGWLDVGIAKVADVDVHGEDVRRLRMGLDSWIGFALPDVQLSYDVADRRLLRFEGIGSIRDLKSHNQDVRIEFPATDRRTGVAQHDIDAAAAVPLVARCHG